MLAISVYSTSMAPIKPSQLDEILKALNAQIALAGGETIGLVVIGGAALLAAGLVSRPTEDVDVLGEVVMDKDLIIKELEKLPDWLTAAAGKVSRDFNLPDNWLNLQLTTQIKRGLPYGFENRLIRKDYGDYLTAFFISRTDQIHFKLYAAADVGKYEARHIQDLWSLDPTENELLAASHWILRQEVPGYLLSNLFTLLEEHEYEHVVQKIQR